MARLPGWVKTNAESLRDEAAPYRGMTPEGRLRLMAMACKAAARQLANRPDRERILAYQDPLPVSSVKILARLRAAYRAER